MRPGWIRNLVTLQILQRTYRTGGDDGIATDRIVHWHDHLERQAARVGHDHLIVGQGGGIQLTTLDGTRHQRVVAEGHEMNVGAVLAVVAIGRRHIDGPIANPVDDTQIQITGRTAWGKNSAQTNTNSASACAHGFFNCIDPYPLISRRP